MTKLGAVLRAILLNTSTYCYDSKHIAMNFGRGTKLTKRSLAHSISIPPRSLHLASSFPNYKVKRNTTRSVLCIDSQTSEEYWSNKRVSLLDSVNYVKQEVTSISSSLLTSQLNDINSVLQGSHGGKVTL